MNWKLTDDRPIYLQLCEQMTLLLASGTWTPGSRIPSVRELAMDAGVNPNTMQRALAQLEADGLVITNRTAGRTVTEDAAALDRIREQLANAQIDAFLDGMATLGFAPDRAIALLKERGTLNG